MAKFAVGGNAQFIWVGTLMGTYIDSISSPPSKTVASLDVTAFGDAAETFIAGIQLSKEFSVTGPYDDTATTGPDAVFAAAVGTVGTWTLYPAGSASGQRRFTGNALPTGYEVGGGVKERVTYTATFVLTGTVVSGTV